MWYGCRGHCEGADERDGEESHCASRLYEIEEVGDKNKIRAGIYKVKETNDTSETREVPEEEKGNQQQDGSLYNSTCYSSAFSSDTPDASQKSESKNWAARRGPAPIESTPIASQRVEGLFHVQTRSGSIQYLSRN